MSIFTKSIRWRIQMWHGSLLVCLVTALLVAFYNYERSERIRELDSHLQSLLTPLLPRLTGPEGRGPRPNHPERSEADEWRQPPGHPNQTRDNSSPPPRFDPRDDDPQGPMANFGPGQPYYYVAWSVEREITAKSANAPDVPYPGKGEPAQTALQTHGEYREFSHNVPSGACVLIGTSTAPIMQKLHRLALGLVGVGLTITIIGFVGGWWLAGRALRPILEISAAAAKISAGNLTKRIPVSETESELGKLAAVLNQTFDQLEKTFEQQVQFTGDASHELRTPIAVILTQIQLALSRERSPEEYRQTLATCERAAERMRILVNQLLELVRMDAGELSVVTEKCDLGHIAHDAAELIAPLAQQKKVTVTQAIESIHVTGDTMKLGQVLLNLLNNAIQHNKEGIEVCLSVQRQGKHAILRVADNGAGISSEAVPHLFDRFYRADKARSRGKGNSGLGLAISKAIIEAHHGTISVESELGKGTTFVIQLPLSQNFTSNPV